MRAGGRILMLFGFILAVIAGIATFFVLQSNPNVPGNEDVQPEQNTVQVVVAEQNIEPWEEIPEGAVTLAEYPAAAVRPEAVLAEMTVLDERTGEEVTISGIDFVLGKISNTRIYPGQIIVDTQLIEKDLEELRLGLGSDASYIVPDGQVAVVIPVNSASLIAGALRAGDQIDIIAAISVADPADEEAEPETVSQILIQQVQILRVGFWSPTQEEEETVGEVSQTYVTVLVTPQQAVELKTIKDQTSYEFALRSITDEADFATEPVDLDYLIELYNVRP